VRLLVAEDDARLCDVLARGLRGAGYSVDVASRGDEALSLLLLNTFDAAVVDWRMPAMDGVEVVTALRARGLSVPVLMLTARDTPSDRIRGLDAGCDDYLVKPFDFQELLARLRALMRRPAESLGVRLRVGALIIDPAGRGATVNGEAIALTPTEYAIVELLARRSPAVVRREAIANHAWPDSLDPIASNAIDVHIARLRAKLVVAGVRFEAMRRVGYRLIER
jgi:DNA-binding response OmpR family regulator